MLQTWRLNAKGQNETHQRQAFDPETARPIVQQACNSCRVKKVSVLFRILRITHINIYITAPMLRRKNRLLPLPNPLTRLCLRSECYERIGTCSEEQRLSVES
jgi:hypothetical protein